MDLNPYSVSARNRPLRVVFLMSEKGDKDNQIDSLVDYCLYVWGGRLNPIIITDGKDIAGDWWDFLQKYDPDVVLTFVDLTEKLIRKIDHFICPMFIQKLDGRDDGRYVVKHECVGFQMLPNDAYLHWGRRYELVVFEDTSKDKEINRFLSRNFGVYNNLAHTEDALSQVTKKYPCKVDSEETLANVLQQLSKRENFHTYPMEYLGKWTPMPDVQHEDRTDCFAVIVGDSIQDFAHYWNRQLAVTDYKRTSFNQLWLSKKVAKNPKLQEALKALIDKEANWDGHSNTVRFESLSLKQVELEKIAKELIGLHAHLVCEAMDKPRMPFFNDFREFQEGDSSFALEKTQQFSLNGQKDIFTITPPQNIKGYHQDDWVVDLKIGYQPQNYGNNVINCEQWWKIPRHLGVVSRMFNNRSARVTKSRFPACLCSKNGCTIQLELPKEYWLFSNLICDEKHYSYGDLRKDLKNKNDYGVETSQQGRNLRGLFGLFNDNFSEAENILSEPFWVDVLNKFCKE
ncbi:hypothetical protein HYZ98_04725, partial [Candidatus Peregrinibacteria bacterium]|nr:hypothetical protein [Candidatus Peregrinibacteria bacterium]